MEMFLLKHSRFLDEANRRTAEGDFTVVARWQLDRTSETLEDDEECERIGKLFADQPEITDAFVAPYPEQNKLWIEALMGSKPLPVSAMTLSEEIGERLKDEFPWSTVELEDWEKPFLYTARIDSPSPDSIDAYRAQHKGEGDAESSAA